MQSADVAFTWIGSKGPSEVQSKPFQLPLATIKTLQQHFLLRYAIFHHEEIDKSCSYCVTASLIIIIVGNLCQSPLVGQRPSTFHLIGLSFTYLILWEESWQDDCNSERSLIQEVCAHREWAFDKPNIVYWPKQCKIIRWNTAQHPDLV